MPIDNEEWSELEPEETIHNLILGKFEENPNTAFSVADLDEAEDDDELEEDTEFRSGNEKVAFEVTRTVMGEVYKEQTRTICDQLVYEGKLELRIDENEGTDYYRLADS